MKTKDYKQHAWARWLFFLCLTALSALPQTARADIESGKWWGNMPGFKVITSTNSISLDDPYIVLSMDLLASSTSPMKLNAYAWKEFNIYITGPNGKVISVASMADMGYAVATRSGSSISMMPGFYPNTSSYTDLNGGNTSWTSNRPKISQYCTHEDMPHSFYGLQDGYFSAGAATGEANAQYTIKIAILPGLFYYNRPGVKDDENETITITVEGTSINYKNEEQEENHTPPSSWKSTSPS